jgi:hypothetical protein
LAAREGGSVRTRSRVSVDSQSVAKREVA